MGAPEAIPTTTAPAVTEDQPTPGRNDSLTPTEEAILKIISTVLNRPLDKIQLSRSFLAQGGDSLLAIKVMGRCRSAGYAIRVQDLLQAGSLGEFCEGLTPKPSPCIAQEGSHDGTPEPSPPLPPLEVSNMEIPLDHVDPSVIATLGTPQDVESIFPCSATQEMFLAAQSANPDMYNITAVLDLQTMGTGSLDIPRIYAAWSMTVQRHAALRTVFIDSARRPGRFNQVVLRQGVPLVILDQESSSLPDEPCARHSVSFPAHAPAYRAAVYPRTGRGAYFRLDISHALADGESLYMLARDVRAAYTGRLPAQKPMDYRAFVSHQQSLSPSATIAYWTDYLSGAEASFLPVLAETGSKQSGLATARMHIDADYADFCGRVGATPANICQVAWALVLGAYTASADVCFSYASSGRQVALPGVEEAVGSFADTVIFRFRGGDRSPSVAEALVKAQREFVAGFAHPSALVLEDEGAARRFARLRGNTLMSCQRALAEERGSDEGLGFGIIEAVTPSEYDLTINIQIGANSFDMTFDYWQSRLSPSTIDSVARSFRTAILDILQSEAAPLSSLDVISPEDIGQLQTWCGAMPPRVDERIHDGVYQQRLVRPDALAIEGWDGNFTYAELDDAANALAAHLVSLSVGPEVKVPLCFHKSKWAIVAQLAILKAGGCVVPIGITQPSARTAVILQDLRASLVLADAENAARFRDMVSSVVVVDASLVSSLPPSPPFPCAATADSCAFVIYTSGSTGVPKGVVLPHGSLCTSLRGLAARFRMDTTARTVQFSAYTFDISIQDIYTTLQTGACLVVISEEDRISRLGAAMANYKVNFAGLTSTVAALVTPDEVPSLRNLVLLGEAVKAAVVDKWLPHASVFNAYGPSECSIQASVNELTPGCDALNIGFPFAGALWVVAANDWNRLAPIGAPGELLIEGPLLARGYLHDEVKTAAVFVGNPVWAAKYHLGPSGERRMYRTGDLVRQNPDGSIAYIGRRDTQIKVRGQRVDVGEIEHHLMRHDHVLDAAAVFPRDGPCKERLVVLVTLRDFLVPGWAKSDIAPVAADQLASARRGAQSLGGYLSALVPEHMVPKIWVPLASMMPQNDSGKLDRKRLGLWIEDMETELYEAVTASSAIRCETATTEGEAGTPLQLQMRDIWATALKIPTLQIPIRDRSFLACGGDSIAAMQVVSQCRAQGISIGVRAVLQAKSLAELAVAAGQVKDEPAPPAPKAGVAPEKLNAISSVLAKLNIGPEDVEDLYPCSPMQQGILVSQAKDPSLYIIQQSFQVLPAGNSNSVHAEGIMQAWQMLINRHPMLRTVFLPAILSDEGDGLFDQLVLTSHQDGIRHVQCTDEEVASRLAINTEITVGGSGKPAHTLTVYSTPSGRVFVQLVISHALVDASSLLILQEELISAYDGVLAAQDPGPSYAAYIAHLRQTPAKTSTAYWTSHLSSVSPCHLPALTQSGFPLIAPTTTTRAPLEFVTAEVPNASALRSLGASHGITPATVFQLAWALVLSQYTGSRDVCFGYLSSGRDAPVPGVDALVGPLIHTVVSRVQLHPDSTVSDTLRAIQQDFLESLPHQHTGLLDVLHALRLEGDKNSLFNTSLSYRHAPGTGTGTGRKAGGISLEMVSVEDPTEYDANVNVFVSDSGISVMLQYKPGFASEEGAARVMASLLRAVACLVERLEEGRVGDVGVVTPEEVERLWGVNQPRGVFGVGDGDGGECIHDLVHQQRVASPEAKAVCAWDGDMTYRELEEAAERLARHLVVELGVGPEVIVASCLDKSRWAVVAQLAVLKAGGVVVSINPAHPTQRIQTILSDTQAVVLLTTRQHGTRFDSLLPYLPIDDEFLSTLPPLPTNPISLFLPATKPSNAAFVIYTSGSTGTPKGVILTHLSLTTSFRSHGLAYGMDSQTRTVQFAAYTFDASISDIFATLSHGGCVCVISDDERMNNLAGAMTSYGVNLAQLTPTVAGLLDPAAVPSLRTLVLGGEAVKPGTVEGFVRAGVRVINGYGPSECSVYTTCQGPLDGGTELANIGRAMAGSVWVVNDTDGTVCPLGGIGELWIQGPLLARGYLNNQAKTEASFVTDPVWAAEIPGLRGERFYRTGDLVRQNVAGEIIYMGRKDTQVKIRGQRVEIGEIEHKVKMGLPAAFGTVAVSLVMPSGNPTLVVSVETHAADNESDEDILPLTRELRDVFSRLCLSLAESLPSYMVPRRFVPFSKLPSTSSGKLDRRALNQALETLLERGGGLDDDYNFSNRDSTFAPPSTPTESALQGLWAEVLNRAPSQIGANDHFLYSGGDSFTAMRLVSKADAAGLPLTVADVFRHPKLSDMASYMDQKSSAAKSSDDNIDMPPFALWSEMQASRTGQNATISPADETSLERIASQCGIPASRIEDIYPCTPLQEGLMAVTAQQPRAYVNRWMYRVPAGLDCARLKDAWQTVARAAPLLRTRIVPGESVGALQVVIREDVLWAETDDLDYYFEQEENNASMTYGTPLVRLALVGSQEQRLFVFTAHHSIYDGWSWTRLFGAVARVYHRPDALVLSPSFQGFVHYLAQLDHAAAQSFWKAQLVDASATPFPPRPRHSHQPNPTQTTSFDVEMPSCPGNVTTPALLRAAWALVVSSHSGSDVIFGAVLSGRTAPVKGILDMLGPTITTVPVRMSIDRAQSVADFLAAVQAQAVLMMPFEHTGLQNIHRYIGSRVELGHLFTVQPTQVRTSLVTDAPLGLELHTEPSTGADDYGLSVECITGLSPEAGGAPKMRVQARYDPEMVSVAQMERIFSRFRHILAQLQVASADGDDGNKRCIRDVEVISPEEVAQLSQWNSHTPPQKQCLVHELVREAGVGRQQHPAICAWDGDMTHGELDALAEKLAHCLISLGIGPEVAVPLCFDKSKWAVVSMLAVLKAGGVVVPISAEPVQRAQAVLADTGAELVLVSHTKTGQSFPGVRALAVDDALLTWLPTPQHAIHNDSSKITPAPTPHNAAFIIYTSGSTGRPKGVVLDHASMSTSMQAHGARFGMTPATRAFQFASFTFDISLHDMLTTLQFGGCVCIPSETERTGDVAGAMRRMRVNYSFLPPRLLPTLDPSETPGLQTLIVGGEATQPGDIAPWLGRMRVFNAYGPAECCIISTCTEMVEVPREANIGHALAGGLWVVDETDPDRLVPIGSVGELFIEGPLLARGYLNDAEKSAAAFAINPGWVTAESGSVRRMYRTGDLVRQNDDGSFTYIGRRDSQVKIRGQRVEIGEVEHHLRQHPSVCDAAVVYPKEGPSASRLVALLVLNELLESSVMATTTDLPQPTTPDRAHRAAELASSVRGYLVQHLPPYMVPDVWISLQSMPQNNSNKMDRPKLTAWVQSLSADDLGQLALPQQHDTAAACPVGDVQIQLQGVIVDVLRLPAAEKAAMNRSFLSLGGDSISAMQVVSYCRLRHGISLTVRDVLQAASIAQLADKASSTRPAGSGRDAHDSSPAGPLVQRSLRELLLELPSESSLDEDHSVGESADDLRRLRSAILSQTGIEDLSQVEDVHLCSPIQQGIVMSQIKGHATYNVQQICEIQSADASGRVGAERLAEAWSAVVERHSILRTVFVQTLGRRAQGQTASSASIMFYQVVLAHWKPQAHIIAFPNAEDAVAGLSRQEEPPHTDAEPAHHLTLGVTPSGAAYAKLEISHALADAASLRLIFRDVVAAYQGRLPEYPAPLYGSYAHFLQQTSESDSLGYWTRRLADAQPCYLPPSTASLTEERCLKTVATRVDNPCALHALRDFRDKHGVTMANMAQLAWALVLSRYTGSTDTVFGYLTSGRDAPVPDADEIVGPMINMLVSRIQLHDLTQTVADAAGQVQQDFFESLNHQRTSLSGIQHALHLSEQSPFNTTVSYFRPSPEHAPPPSPSGLAIRNISGEDPTEYDANLSILAGEDAIELSLQYSTSFMDEDSATLVLANLQNTLLSMPANADSQLRELDALTPLDLDKLKLWNATPAATMQQHETCVHHLIRGRCVSQPTADAVDAWDGKLSYSELHVLSDRLAHHLNTLGLSLESTVGVCFEKSMWNVVAMLAVLKAGSVIVPLGVQVPQQRLRTMMEKAKIDVVLTSAKHAAMFGQLGVTHAVVVDAALFPSLPEDVGPLAQHGPAGPDNAAVVIYTSGSTGVPKGVVLSHGGLSTSLDVHGAKLGLGTGTRALQYSAYVFDLSLLDILGTLRFGGCVCVPSEDARLDIHQLAVFMEAMHVNSAVLTPTVASLIDPPRVPSLRTLVLAGEAVQPALVETWSSRVVLFNGYGPAECTVLSTIHGPMTDKNLSRNVGKPLAGVVWVVDEDDHNSLVPIGTVGELLIEGPLVSRGYLDDPEMTRAAFTTTNPSFLSRLGFSSEPGSTASLRRMYRTGDLVRQSPVDGSITYVGRKDGQVKVHGQRLELGDIEHWAKRAFGEAQTVAAHLVAPRVRAGEPLLAIVLEMARPKTTTSENNAEHHPSLAREVPQLLPLWRELRGSLIQLQSALAQSLPSFMVPSLYVPVIRMPLTASGKLDRKSLGAFLSDLETAQLRKYALADSPDESRLLTDTESRLGELWSAVLGTPLSEIRHGSHFFRLGGDSVTAMRLGALAADRGIYLNAAAIFKNPTLEKMAAVAAAAAAAYYGARERETNEALDAAPFSLMPDSWDTPENRLSCAAQCKVAPEAIQDVYPCTPLQEGLLALTEQDPSAYVGRWVFRMDETVDAGRLQRAWEKVSEAAPILRTRIISVSSEDAQIGAQVVVQTPPRWSVVSSDLESYLGQDNNNNRGESMGFGTELVRFAIVKTPEASRFLVWTAHHSVYDGWSSRKLLEAVRDVYLGRDLPRFVPYTRFIKCLQHVNTNLDAQAYWQSQLSGGLGSAFPALPRTHKARPPSTIRLQVTDLNAAAGDDGTTTTTATLLRAAWALVLSQETGSPDVVFAAPLSGRTAPVPGVLDMAAPTVATVPVHVRIDRNQSVADYLEAVQRQATEMMPFEHVGLQRIRQLLGDDGKTLELNHLFVIQPSSDRLGRGGGGVEALLPPGLEAIPSGHVAAAAFYKYPLVVECSTDSLSQGGIVEIEACFDDSLIPGAKMQALLERFRHVLVQLRVAGRGSSSNLDGGAAKTIAGVDLLGPQDMALIRGWNTWRRDYSTPVSNNRLHDLVQEQFRVHPDARAVQAWDGQLTYAELDQLSLRLAHHLVDLGVGPEIPVVMMLEKSVWAVVSQLAILRAGGIVVPVGFNHPTKRVLEIIQATGSKIMLTTSKDLDTSGYAGLITHVLPVGEALLDTLPSDGPTQTRKNQLDRLVGPTNAAFIIFTSGSTGVPKGVVLEHHSLVSSLHAEKDVFAAPPNGKAMRVLQFSAYTFDVSLAETFMPLISGGCVCVPSEDDRVSNLATAMESLGVNLAYLTPTVAGLLHPDKVPTLEALVLIGEALSPEVASPWVGQVRVFNAYGPAECTILATSSRQIVDAADAPSIGTGMAGSNLWVVNPADYHSLVPIGLPGELLIEGPLLARGYLGDELKTSEAFVSNPAWLGHFDFGPSQRRRFYRTGDLVVQATDGSITYLGRRDTQIKLHGQRLEIGEIEHRAREALGTRAGACVVGVLTSRETGPSPTLAMAVEMSPTSTGPVAAPSLLPLSDDLRWLLNQARNALSKVLPSYMVPQLYFPVDRIPTTDSGKLDRRRLWDAIEQSRPWPQQQQQHSFRERVPPQTEMERQLHEAWASVLKRSDLSCSDSFFQSGGDSISAMRLVAKVRDTAKVSLTVADVFQHPVLSDLAAVSAKRQRVVEAAASYQPFSSLGLADPTSFIQESIKPVLFAEHCAIVDAGPVTDFQALSVVSSLRDSRDLLAHVTLDGEGICDVERWTRSCYELIRRHEILRTAYVRPEARLLLQVVLREWQPEIRHVEVDGAAADEVTLRLVAEDMGKPPRLGQPFAEFAIITSPARHRVLFRLSHAEYDAISMGYLLDDLQAIYLGEASPTKPSTFIRHVSDISSSPEKSRSYWQGLVQGSQMPCIAPDNHPAPSRLIHHATRMASLPDQGLLSETNTTAATLMRAAWGLTLARFADTTDVVFGEVVSGRNAGHAVATETVGCCANIVPVRIAFCPGESAGSLVETVQAQHMSRLPHEAVGFREILERHFSGTFFTTRVNHLDHAPQWTLKVGGATYQAGISLPEGAEDPSDIAITSVSVAGGIEVAFGYREGAVTTDVANQLLSCLCATIETLAKSPADLELGPLLGKHGDEVLGVCRRDW